MVSVARKNLFEEKTRFIISVSGLAFAVLLILLITGIMGGVTIAAVAHSERTEADIWVGEKGTTVIGRTSVVPANLQARIRDVEGVRDVHPIITSMFAVKTGDEEAGIILVGYDPNSNVGGPWKMAEGTSKLVAGQTIIDRTFASMYGFSVGDSLEILDKEFTVVGLSDETNVWWVQYVFFTMEDASDLLRLEELVSYFLVSVSDTSRTETVAERISNALDVTAFTKEEVVSAYRADSEGDMPFIYVMDAIGFIVGTAVIGLTIVTLTFEKTREYAVLRAIGASNRRLYGIVFGQSLIIALFGFVAGILVTGVFAILMESFMPQVMFVLVPESMVPVFLLTLGMSLVASYLPIRRTTRVDPAMAFRA
ncbi:MAG: ABC transporter permease [Candidatus Geothermarchaeales archaeon]